MSGTLVSTGERIANDDSDHVFVHGAYNLGPVLEKRTLSTTAAHPGEHVSHVTTAGGEDFYIIGPDATADSYAILEVDFGLIADCSVDYTHTTDEVPGIPYHMNPGAYLRNIVCADPNSSDVSPDQLLCTVSGAAGSFIAHHTEMTMATEADNEGWPAGTTSAALAAQLWDRCPLRQAYFLTDPSAVYDTVAYVKNG